VYIIITVSCPGTLILKKESSTSIAFKKIGNPIGTPIESPIGTQIGSQIKKPDRRPDSK